LVKPARVLIGLASLSVVLFTGHFIYLKNQIDSSEKLKSSNIESISIKEKEKLGLQNTPIRIEFFDKSKHISRGTSYSSLDNSLTNFLVVLDKGQEKRGVLKHELYHVKKHCLKIQYQNPNTISSKLNEFVDEYCANVYSVHGIQLQK